MEKSADRVAKNDATFRDANEQIRKSAESVDMPLGIPFLCECADESCTAIIRIPLDEYERVRRNSTWFFNALGHDKSAGPHARAVEEHQEYAVVEKVGRAAELVEELDPRESAR
jgi:hypothetical protein